MNIFLAVSSLLFASMLPAVGQQTAKPAVTQPDVHTTEYKPKVEASPAAPASPAVKKPADTVPVNPKTAAPVNPNANQTPLSQVEALTVENLQLRNNLLLEQQKELQQQRDALNSEAQQKFEAIAAHHHLDLRFDPSQFRLVPAHP